MKPILIAASLATLAFPAIAQEEAVCMPTGEAEAALLDWYGETPVSGNAEDGHMIWAAGIGKSWTLLSYEPGGMSCTLAQGDNWSPQLHGDAMVAQVLLEGSGRG